MTAAAPVLNGRPHDKILVLDDETPLAEVWSEGLATLGYEMQGVFATGEEGLASALAKPPDIALVDINLAGPMSGVEASARMRIWRDVQIIFCSAYERAEVPGLGALTYPYDYLEKPFTFEELAGAVHHAAGIIEKKNTQMPLTEEQSSSRDHDLLVRLDTKLDLLSIQLNEARVAVAGKAEMAHIEPRLVKIEARVEATQNKIYMFMGGLAVVEILLKFIKF